MDIRNWPMGQIMQLPDHFFGRRWPLHWAGHAMPGETHRGLIGASLPEKIVIWEIAILAGGDGLVGSYVDLRLGDHEPATQLEYWAFESVFGSHIVNAVYPRTFMFSRTGAFRWTMRFPLTTMGRRFAVEMRSGSSEHCNISVVIVISSMPTEVPDCLLNSEHLRSL